MGARRFDFIRLHSTFIDHSARPCTAPTIMRHLAKRINKRKHCEKTGFRTKLEHRRTKIVPKFVRVTHATATMRDCTLYANGHARSTRILLLQYAQRSTVV